VKIGFEIQTKTRAEEEAVGVIEGIRAVHGERSGGEGERGGKYNSLHKFCGGWL
jgi:uncharacterized protein YcbK (DUF882 family)